MKKIALLFILAGMVFGGSSCHVDIFDDDYWYDNVRFSDQQVKFEHNEGSMKITTRGEYWYVEGVTVEGRYYRARYDSNQPHREDILLRADWLSLEREDGRTLWLDVEQNRSRWSRHATIHVRSGSHHETISVTQRGY